MKAVKILIEKVDIASIENFIIRRHSQIIENMEDRKSMTYTELMNVSREQKGTRADVLIKTLLRCVRRFYQKEFEKHTGFARFKNIYGAELMIASLE